MSKKKSQEPVAPETTIIVDPGKGPTHLQICVPKEYTDRQVEEFANEQHPLKKKAKWGVMDQEDGLADPQRVSCDKRTGCVHVMLAK